MSKERNKFKLSIPIYGWEVDIIRMKLHHPSHRFPHELVDRIDKELIDELKDDLNSGGRFGKSISNNFHREAILIVCAEDYSGPEYVGILAHETNHLIDKIVELAKIYDTEARSYLAGYIYEKYREIGLI